MQPLRYKQYSANQGLVKTPERKSDIAQEFNVDSWQLTISGDCDNPITLDYDDLTKFFPLEERIYCLRCVEAWSMVIPWISFIGAFITYYLECIVPSKNN